MKIIKHKVRVTVFITLASLMSTACMKEFLDLKRDKSQVIPRTIQDYQAIFENNTMNYYSSHLLGVIASDDYYVAAEQWQILSNPIEKNGYIWADEVYQGTTVSDWNRAYEKILYANFVLEGVTGIDETPANKSLRDEVMGAAHYFRGVNFFLLAQLFCRQYDATTADEDLGLPLNTASNTNVRYKRASLSDTYNQIIYDLEKAGELLPHTMSLNTRPYRAASLGMLANVYLQMGDYSAALRYADEAITLAPQIFDYNSIDVSPSAPFPRYGRSNTEIIFYSHMTNAAILASSRLTIDSLLYESYDENDLRKQAYFFVNGGRYTFKGSYSGISSFLFSGLTTPELLLVRAECHARLGNTGDGIADLNRLLSHRFRPEHFEPVADDISQSELLQLTLSERRKELVFRGRRWHDLKRFNKDEHLALPLKRILDGTEYNLPIGSEKWVWPIPPDVISQGDIEQNPR